MKHQFMPVTIADRNADRDVVRDGLFEEGVANLVGECRGMIAARLKLLLATVSSEVLAERLWQGSIDPSGIRQALLGLDHWQGFLAELSAELSGLAAGILRCPVRLQLLPEQDASLLHRQVGLLGEQLAWSRETHILGKALMEACNLVWNRAVADCAWPVRKLKPGKLLWCLLGNTPLEEKRRCLQELTRAVEGARINMQQRLFRELSLLAARQIWSIYDSRSEDRASGLLMHSQADHCA